MSGLACLSHRPDSYCYCNMGKFHPFAGLMVFVLRSMLTIPRNCVGYEPQFRAEHKVSTIFKLPLTFPDNSAGRHGCPLLHL